MEAIEMLKTRRSCRSFKKEQLKEENLQEILDCGLNAPSGMNRQDTRIVVLQDPELIQVFSRLNGLIWGRDSDPFYGAPTVALVLATKENPNNVKDGSLVIGAMQDGAYALGIGSCWINRCKEMLETQEGNSYLTKWGLEDYVGVGCVSLGYPDLPDLPHKIKEGRIIRL